MDSTLWYLCTFGIPLLGVVLCIVGGTLCFRLARAQRIPRVLAALGFLALSALPFGLAMVAIEYGNYIARTYQRYAFYGENTWGLNIFMGGYLLLAAVSNLALWLALAPSRKQYI